MSKTFTVKIGERDYTLVGENEELVQKAANEVNILFEELKKKYGNLPFESLIILTALNLAERNLISEMNSNYNIDYIKKEINDMSHQILKSMGSNRVN